MKTGNKRWIGWSAVALLAAGLAIAMLYSQPEVVRGWSVVLGTAGSAADAQDLLDRSLNLWREPVRAHA